MTSYLQMLTHRSTKLGRRAKSGSVETRPPRWMRRRRGIPLLGVDMIHLITPIAAYSPAFVGRTERRPQAPSLTAVEKCAFSA
jgi:hypothetical protein